MLFNNSSLQAITAFLEHSPTLYFAKINIAGEYTYVNELYKKDFAHIYTNFIGEIASKSVHISDVEICNAAGYECLLHPEKVVSVDFRKAGGNEADIFLRWNIFAIKNEHNEVAELGFVGFNITDHQTEKIEHKTTLQKLQAVLNNSDESFYFLDKSMKVISFNHGAENASKILFNVAMHEGYDFTKNLVAGTEEGFYHQFNQALAGIETSREDEITFPTGLNFWFKLTMKPAHDDTGEIVGVALSYINIDTLKINNLLSKHIQYFSSIIIKKIIGVKYCNEDYIFFYKTFYDNI